MTGKRTDATVVTVSTIIAMLAIVTPIIGIGQPIQFIATLGGILIGPGGLAYRLMTGSKWSECLMVGVALNISALMILGLIAVVLHSWHPKIELIIPMVTCVLASALYLQHRQRKMPSH